MPPLASPGLVIERVAGGGSQHVVAVDETVVNREGKGLGVAQVREEESKRAKDRKRGHDPVGSLRSGPRIAR